VMPSREEMGKNDVEVGVGEVGVARQGVEVDEERGDTILALFPTLVYYSHTLHMHMLMLQLAFFFHIYTRIFCSIP